MKSISKNSKRIPFINQCNAFINPVKILSIRFIDFVSGKTFLTDPKSIKYLIRKSDLIEFGCPMRPMIVDGDWDLKKQPIEDTELFKAFRCKFIEGGDWCDTMLYKHPDAIHSYKVNKLGGPKKYAEYYEHLFHSISKHGYRTGPLDNVIYVHIGRDGELIRHDGWHRLTIAILLKIPYVRVKVFYRHKKTIDNN